MNEVNVFVSVGATASDSQEAFVQAVEARLRSEGLIPHTVGRNTFSSNAPLKAVTDLMDRCTGTVVIALERSYFPSGVEKRNGPKETHLSDIKLPTPWNHIEAAMAYSRNHPLMVIVEDGLKNEGLLEHGNEWYVQSVKLSVVALNTSEFNGILSNWKQKILAVKTARISTPAPSELTVGQLIANLKPAQLYGVFGAIATLIAGSFAVGAKLFGG